MKRIGLLMTLGLTFIAMNAAYVWAAEVPEKLRGEWILNQDATQEYMKKSPKWKPGDEVQLPKILAMMSKADIKVEDGAIAMKVREGKEARFPVTLKSHEDGKYIFSAKVGDKPVTLTITLDKDDNLNFRSSASDDMDYYLWKRRPKK